MDLIFLEELYKEKDNSNGFVSMYDLGERIGFDRTESDDKGMYLITEGFAELVNLSGGIKITEKGITECMKSGISTGVVETADNIGNDEVITEVTKRSVNQFIEDLKFSNIKSDEFKADLNTLSIQFASPKPKTEILKACLFAIAKQLTNQDLKNKIESFIS
ncbi:MAG: hypothetical protein GY714_08840 [Desulfobacterales bacterium]|nr:hypothetical protein [Desulfobacterales bacterium]MCP4163845.1 hypothetical protein [Deltaproteobacteria bacterium]